MVNYINKFLILVIIFFISCDESNTNIKKEYYQTGELKKESNYINDTILMASYYFYKNGNFKEKSYYENSVRDGIRKGYYVNGGLEYEISYKEGVRNGIAKWYYQNGVIKSVQNSLNGDLVCESIHNDSLGLIKEYLYYNRNSEMIYKKVYSDSLKLTTRDGFPFKKITFDKKEKYTLGESFEIVFDLINPPYFNADFFVEIFNGKGKKINEGRLNIKDNQVKFKTILESKGVYSILLKYTLFNQITLEEEPYQYSLDSVLVE